MIIALIAHDKKKDEMVEFAKKYKETLAKYDLVATGTTGKRVEEATGLPVKKYLSGTNDLLYETFYILAYCAFIYNAKITSFPF